MYLMSKAGSLNTLSNSSDPIVKVIMESSKDSQSLARLHKYGKNPLSLAKIKDIKDLK